MTASLRSLRAFWDSERAVAVTEYGLLIAVVAIALAIALQLVVPVISGFLDESICLMASGDSC